MGFPNDAGIDENALVKRKKDTIAVYGGSFDPPTMGHLNVIHKIMKFADKLHVVVAVNKDKINSSSFTFKERNDLLLDYIKTYLPDEVDNIVITSLPSNEFLANYANEVEAKLLIRGLRDTIDFTSEQKIEATNKKIAPDLETIFVMPDAQYALVSSSWVKGLVGMYGWQEVLADSISPLTLAVLEEKWLEKEFFKIFEAARSRALISPTCTGEWLWDKISSKYDRPYHNLSHIARTLEACRNYYRNVLEDENKKLVAELAIIFHDIEETEEDSFTACDIYLGLAQYRYVKKLIMATAHTSENKDEKTEDEIMIASCDLLILAAESSTYEAYKNNVKKEYRLKAPYKDMDHKAFDLAWNKGRLDFIKKMLAKETIFPKGSLLPSSYEDRARKNLKFEGSNLAASLGMSRYYLEDELGSK